MNSTNQIFVVTAEHRTDPSVKLTQFLIEAQNHRAAWGVARQVCQTGQGAQYRDPHTQELHDFPINPGQYTVKRVLSASATKRGRPPKLTADDLLAVAEASGAKVPAKIRRMIELMTN